MNCSHSYLEMCVNAAQAACLQKPALPYIRVGLVTENASPRNDKQFYSFISSSYEVLVMNFIPATAVVVIPVLLPDFRQMASYVSFVFSGNSI